MEWYEIVMGSCAVIGLCAYAYSQFKQPPTGGFVPSIMSPDQILTLSTPQVDTITLEVPANYSISPIVRRVLEIYREKHHKFYEDTFSLRYDKITSGNIQIWIANGPNSYKIYKPTLPSGFQAGSDDKKMLGMIVNDFRERYPKKTRDFKRMKKVNEILN